ncbi:unnamed protein product [Penicillium salamii]|nr:unnamed protein product [Penicillium salamii]
MHLRSGFLTFIQSLYSGAAAGAHAIRSGTWSQYQYQLLGTQPQKTKQTFTVTGLVATAILTLWFLASYNSQGPLSRYSCEHPVVRLVDEATKTFNETLQRQSTTLEEAVAEYHRRHKMPPPPHFDEWYTFATARNTVLIDEFDTIYHTLQPFWGLQPSTIRSRVREDLGYNNFVMGAAVRDGRVMHLGNTGQQEFQKDATIKILEKFSQWLPDMLLEFNVHDEPRVAVPHEELHRLITKGYETQARLDHTRELLNTFSKGDAHDPLPPAEIYTTRFNDIQRQETWLFSRLSCPPDTPARSLDGNAPDNSSAFAIEPLGFIFNQTAASDMCNSPSLRHRLGVFDRPNSFKVTNELTPVFSMSHPSSFQDIAYPSPFYYEGVSNYDEKTAVDWENKKPQLYWRGGTTGGHSIGGAWQNFQRQRIIGNLTHPQSPQYLLHQKSVCRPGRTEGWEVQQANRTDIEGYFNTHFVEIKDCDDDCPAEEQFFDDIREPDPREEAWKYRYLLDMDGHAYSGRFYAFMRSKSVPFKLTFFREWHEDILFPWVHYVPINKDGTEIPELIRFFEQDPAGQQIARSIGQGGQDWAAKTIRNDDIDVYMFRLYLEYARVIDDQRESLGFSLKAQA